MKCERTDALLDGLADGALSAARERELREHLAGCSACRETHAEFEAALTALRQADRAATSPALCASILAAVDAAASADEAGADVDTAVRAEVFRRASAAASMRASGRRRRSALATHALSALLGVAASVLFLWTAESTPEPTRGEAAASLGSMAPEALPGVALLWEGGAARLHRAQGRPGADGELVHAAQPLLLGRGDVLESADLRLELGSDGSGLRVAKRAAPAAPIASEGASERAAPRGEDPTIELVPVYVTRIVERERVVRQGPLIALDLEPLERTAAAFGRSLDRWARESAGALAAFDRRRDLAVRAAERDPGAVARPGPDALAGAEASSAAERASRSGARSERRPGSRSRARLASATGDSGGASLWLDNSAEPARLEMRGALPRLVPMLIAKIDREDAEMSALVVQRLESIRATLASDPVLGPRLRDVETPADERRFGVRWRSWDDGELEAPTPAARWRAWHAVNHELLGAAEAQEQIHGSRSF